MTVELKNNITVNRIRDLWVNKNNPWSTSKYCTDKEHALETEKRFNNATNSSTLQINKVVRPTQNGFFVDLQYTSNESTDSVIVYVPFCFCDLDYEVSIPYAGQGKTVETFFIKYRDTAPDICDPVGTELVKNIATIESNIPVTDDYILPRGPKRVCIFYLNYLLENAIIDSANKGNLTSLGIQELVFADGSYNTFHRGAGTNLPSLKDMNQILYKVEGPLVKLDKLNINESTNADHILYLKNNTLYLYENSDIGYIEINSVPFEFKYEEYLNSIPKTWEEYWGTNKD